MRLFLWKTKSNTKNQFYRKVTFKKRGSLFYMERKSFWENGSNQRENGSAVPKMQAFQKIFEDLIKGVSSVRSIQTNAIQEILKILRTCKTLGDPIIKVSMRTMHLTVNQKTRNFWNTFESAYSCFINETHKQASRSRSMSSRTFVALKTTMSSSLLALQPQLQFQNKPKSRVVKMQVADEKLESIITQFISSVEECESDVDCYYEYALSDIENEQEIDEEEFQKIQNSLKFTEERLLEFYRTNELMLTQQIISDVSLYISKVVQIFSDFRDLRHSKFSIGNLFATSRMQLKGYIPYDIGTPNEVTVQAPEPVEKKIIEPPITKRPIIKQTAAVPGTESTAQLRRKLNVSKENVRKLNNELNKYNQMLEAEKSSLERQQKNNEQKRRECNIAQAEYNSIINDISALEKEKAELGKKLRNLQESTKRKKENELNMKKEFETFLSENDSLADTLAKKTEDISRSLEEYEEQKNDFEYSLAQFPTKSPKKIVRQEYITNYEQRNKLYNLIREAYEKENEYIRLCCIRDRANQFIPQSAISDTNSSKRRLKELKNQMKTTTDNYNSVIEEKNNLIAERFQLKLKIFANDEQLLNELGEARTEYEDIKNTIVPQCGNAELNEWHKTMNRFDSRLYKLRRKAVEEIDSLSDKSQKEDVISSINEEEALEEVKITKNEIERMKKRYIAFCNWTTQLNDTDMKEEARGMSLVFQLEALQEKLKNQTFDENGYLSDIINQLQSEFKAVNKKLEKANSIYMQISSLMKSSD